jgi:hypothetical protein
VTVEDSREIEVSDTAEEEITEALRAFADWVYDQLRAEYDYQTSDKAVEEAIRANEYEFTVDGKSV